MRNPPEDRSSEAASSAQPLTDFGPSTVVAEATLEPGLVVATFLYARVHGFSAACQAMVPEDAAALVTELRRMLTEVVAKLGGNVAQRRPDSILAVFSNRAEEKKPNHAQRGLHAAILAVHEVVQLSQALAARPHLAGLPPLKLAVGVHLGPAEVKVRSKAGNGMVHAVGEGVDVARMLEAAATDLHWSIAASAGTRVAAGGRAEGGRIGSLSLPDDSFVEVVEVTGLAPRKGSSTPLRVFDMLRESLQLNQRWRSGGQGASPAASYFLIEGYRVLRRIGEGATASIFLAQPAAGGPPQVLKVMRLDQGVEADALQRFVQEFALLAQLDHPNVARIFRQDFAVGHACVAMEYFPRGDLRQRMREPVDADTAIGYIRQVAAGLGAIHAVGIAHCDLQPDNLMLRQDGSLAIADFGVARQVLMKTAGTGDGDSVGTPRYLSPEQALGQPVDARCDLYSLGVLAYELLAGCRPCHATSARELLHMHVHGPVPLLPREFQHLQVVLQGLMAKDREERYPSAQTLLDELARMGL